MGMRPFDISRALAALIPTRQSVCLLGATAVGKSSMAIQAGAAFYGAPTYQSTVKFYPDQPWLVVVKGLDRDIVDFRGLPTVIKVKRGGQIVYKTKFSEPDLIEQLHARPEGGMVLLEELPQSTKPMQSVMREMILDHRIGGVKFPDTWMVIATGNRPQDNAGANQLLSHVASSCTIIEPEVSVEDWQGWAVNAGVSPDVRAFINFQPGMLHNFKPERLINDTPRGWERVSIQAEALPDDLLHPVLSGVVQPESVSQFIAFRKIYKGLPDLTECLTKPEKALVPSEPSVAFATCSALAERCRSKETTKDNLNNLFIYAGRLTDKMAETFGVLLVRDIFALRPESLNLSEAKTWLRNPEVRQAILGSSAKQMKGN